MTALKSTKSRASTRFWRASLLVSGARPKFPVKKIGERFPHAGPRHLGLLLLEWYRVSVTEGTTRITCQVGSVVGPVRVVVYRTTVGRRGDHRHSAHVYLRDLLWRPKQRP